MEGPQESKPGKRDAEGKLTPREWQVLHRVAEGQSNCAIGSSLGIATGTARKHVEHILEKLGMKNRTAAARWYLEQEIRGG